MSSSFDYRTTPFLADSRFADSSLVTTPTRDTHVAARPRRPLHIVTPLIDADVGGRRVSLKLDNLQPARSFKLRGIGRLCQHHAERGAKRFVCSSAGNAGYAVAWVGRELGIPVTVVVPLCTPQFVRNRIHALGAEVHSIGNVWDEANSAALELAKEPGSAFIPPFDHPLIWEGHSSLVEELAEQCSEVPDAILLAVGGGGLLLGVLEGLRKIGWLDTRVLAVEPECAAALGPSLLSGEVVELAQPHSVASSLCVKRVAPSLVSACRGRRVTALTVSDDEATNACVRMAQDHGMLLEPACGAALAPLFSAHPALAGARNVVVVVCGGMVVTLEQLAKWSH